MQMLQVKGPVLLTGVIVSAVLQQWYELLCGACTCELALYVSLPY